MAHTNQTAHYHLPQYVGTDIINPLTDTNGAYEAIDTAIYEVGQTASGMASDIDALKIQNGDSALDTTAQTLSGAINELNSGADALELRVTATETDVSTLQTQMSTATGNITTLNTSVAGLQTEMTSKASATALNNLTTKVGTGNLDTVAQNCVDAINEVKAAIPSGGGAASSITYDNTDSGLTATNVQDAIDEVKADIPTIPTSYDADDIVYDNQTSGLTATNAQGAIDELASRPSGCTFNGKTAISNNTDIAIDWNTHENVMFTLYAQSSTLEYALGSIIVNKNDVAGEITNFVEAGTTDYYAKCDFDITASGITITSVSGISGYSNYKLGIFLM